MSSKQTRIIDNSITYIDDDTNVLGRGGFGKVYIGTCKGFQSAIKQVPTADVKGQEKEALESLNHQNVVKLFHYSAEDDGFR